MHVLPLLQIEGEVQVGKRQGNAFGYPTANIPYIGDLRGGTYAGHVVIAGDTMKRAAAVYVDEERRLLEAHILDFSGDLYGKKITVTLLEHVAGSQKFSDEFTLKEFIDAAVIKVKDFFEKE